MKTITFTTGKVLMDLQNCTFDIGTNSTLVSGSTIIIHYINSGTASIEYGDTQIKWDILELSDVNTDSMTTFSEDLGIKSINYLLESAGGDYVGYGNLLSDSPSVFGTGGDSFYYNKILPGTSVGSSFYTTDALKAPYVQRYSSKNLYAPTILQGSTFGTDTAYCKPFTTSHKDTEYCSVPKYIDSDLYDSYKPWRLDFFDFYYALVDGETPFGDDQSIGTITHNEVEMTVYKHTARKKICFGSEYKDTGVYYATFDSTYFASAYKNPYPGSFILFNDEDVQLTRTYSQYYSTTSSAVVLRKAGGYIWRYDLYPVLDVSDSGKVNCIYNLQVGAASSSGVTYLIDNSKNTGSLVESYSYDGFVAWWEGLFKEPEPEDEGETSGAQGGKGSFSHKSDVIGLPGLPEGGGDTGFFTIYVPSSGTIKKISGRLWSENIITQLFNNITGMDKIILGLSQIPITLTVENNGAVKAGFVTLKDEDGNTINAPYTLNRYRDYDCGYISVEKYWNGFLDYQTKFSLYLPFCGSVDLNPSDFLISDYPDVNKLHIVYYCDLITGGCVAYVLAKNRITGSEGVIYHTSGSMSASMPITSQDCIGLIQTVTNVVTSAASGAASGGEWGAVAGAASAALGSIDKQMFNTKSSGSFGSVSGILSLPYPVLYVHQPKQSYPEGSKKLKGTPSNISSTLGGLSGFNKISYIRLTGFNGTEEEQKEFEDILKNGVIV